MKRNAKPKQLPEAGEIVKVLIHAVLSKKASVVCSAPKLRDIANRARLEDSLLNKIREEAARRKFLFAKLPSGGFVVCRESRFKNAVEI